MSDSSTKKMLKDPFLDEQASIDRLIAEYEMHGGLIVAFDFDDTIYDYHKEGRGYPKVIELLRRAQSLGFTLTLFTDLYADKRAIAEAYLDSISLRADYFNETPSFVPFGFAGKPYYNILLDDRAGLPSSYRQLLAVVEYAEAKNEEARRSA